MILYFLNEKLWIIGWTSFYGMYQLFQISSKSHPYINKPSLTYKLISFSGWLQILLYEFYCIKYLSAFSFRFSLNTKLQIVLQFNCSLILFRNMVMLIISIYTKFYRYTLTKLYKMDNEMLLFSKLFKARSQVNYYYWETHHIQCSCTILYP